jgi:hypothetical protein
MLACLVLLLLLVSLLLPPPRSGTAPFCCSSCGHKTTHFMCQTLAYQVVPQRKQQQRTNVHNMPDVQQACVYSQCTVRQLPLAALLLVVESFT